MGAVARAVQLREPADPGRGAPRPPLARDYRDRVPPGSYDEMVDADGAVRAPYRALHAAVAGPGLAVRAAALARATGPAAAEAPDVVPRVLTAGEWSRVQRGVTQRVRALEAFLADVYGDAEILRDRVLPHRLVTGSRGFHRAAHGVVPPNGVRIHVAAVDLLRDGRGAFRVIGSDLCDPVGVAAMIENRRAAASVLPDLFAAQPVRALGDPAAHLLRALRAAAVANEADPTVVVLTPGARSPAHVEHSMLARQMGVELVEGRDLFSRDGVVQMRTTEGERRVDVVHRRLDDEHLDPLQFDADSRLGVAGLLNCARAGSVVIANAVGNGVADDARVGTYAEEMISYYLGEKAVLPGVPSYRCWVADERAHVLAHLDELVLEPTPARSLAAARRAVRDDPDRFVARPVLPPSTAPAVLDGRLVPGQVEMRVFAVHDGETVTVLPGGLSRVTLPGAVRRAKDSWVLATRRTPGSERELGGGSLAPAVPRSAAVEHGPDAAPDSGPLRQGARARLVDQRRQAVVHEGQD
jgi:uncharacterized circularly permuted ATP-grasp superfamily protein